MSVRVRFALLLVAGWLASSPAAAGTMGPLERFLLLGSEGVWEGTLGEEAYRLQNTDPTAAGETRYFFVEPKRDEKRFWTTTVKVKLEPESADEALSFGGIICAVQSQPRSYLAFVIDSSGRLNLLRRDGEGLRPVWTQDANPRDPGTFNELRIVEGEGRYQVFIDGERIRTFNINLSVEGGVGIIAVGAGAFSYRDFALAPTQ